MCRRNTTLLKRDSLYEFTYLRFLAVQSVANITGKHKSPQPHRNIRSTSNMIMPEAVIQICYAKMMFRKISQNSTVNLVGNHQTNVL